LAKIEGVIHPLVAAHRQSFIREAKAPIVVVDVPLLFEIGADAMVDYIVVVSVPGEVQRARVLSRPDMTEEAFQAILDRQMPDDEKRARADTVIETVTLGAAEAAVESLLNTLQKD